MTGTIQQKNLLLVSESVLASHLKRREEELNQAWKQHENSRRGFVRLPHTEDGQNDTDNLALATSRCLTTSQSAEFLRRGLEGVRKALANGHNGHHATVCASVCRTQVSIFSLVEGAVKLSVPREAIPCGKCPLARNIWDEFFSPPAKAA